MVQLLGINLNNNVKVLAGISKVYGLGNYTSRLLLNEMNIGLDVRIKDLPQSILVKIVKWIEKNNIHVESSLKQKLYLNIDKLKQIKAYRGFRHNFGLPTRGQRTKTNASTVKKLYIKRK